MTAAKAKKAQVCRVERTKVDAGPAGTFPAGSFRNDVPLEEAEAGVDAGAWKIVETYDEGTRPKTAPAPEAADRPRRRRDTPRGQERKGQPQPVSGETDEADQAAGDDDQAAELEADATEQAYDQAAGEGEVAVAPEPAETGSRRRGRKPRRSQ